MTRPEVTIRPRQDADLPELVRVMRAVHEADRYPAIWPEDALAFVATTDPLGAWVAEVDGQPRGQVLLCAVGLTGGWAEVYGEGASALAEIKRLFVSPSARGLGLARRLMRVALEDAARRNLGAVLQTLDDNHVAIRFYERAGWHPAGSVPADWTDGDGQHPTMVLFTAPPDA
ncbi:N-acetyltransferase family protein [Deinococcus sp.]|uniref:GNAT family N-acetyltransferase n=1 Tax=Deinococcus sp. TaxID=47478 RepID=UPI003C7D24B7